MYTSIAIAHFFEKFQQQFSPYNFVGAIYEPEMDLSKLKPYILDNKSTDTRNNAWCGIIFNRQTINTGQYLHRPMGVVEKWADPDTKTLMVYKCAPASCEVNFNIVSNEIEHLEALENELKWFYNGRYEYTIDLNKLPSFKLDIGDITYGDFTKYPSTDFGQLCSLGMAVILNYPILLKGSDVNIIQKFNYYLAKEMPKVVYFKAHITKNGTTTDEDSVIKLNT